MLSVMAKTTSLTIHCFPDDLLADVELYAEEHAGATGHASKQKAVVALIRRGLDTLRGDAPESTKREA